MVLSLDHESSSQYQSNLLSTRIFSGIPLKPTPHLLVCHQECGGVGGGVAPANTKLLFFKAQMNHHMIQILPNTRGFKGLLFADF